MEAQPPMDLALPSICGTGTAAKSAMIQYTDTDYRTRGRWSRNDNKRGRVGRYVGCFHNSTTRQETNVLSELPITHRRTTGVVPEHEKAPQNDNATTPGRDPQVFAFVATNRRLQAAHRGESSSASTQDHWLGCTCTTTKRAAARYRHRNTVQHNRLREVSPWPQ